ncbi:TPA: hypothetical protein ACX6IL_000375 [Yersinia enterocolitica]
MNNIKEIIVSLKTRVALAELIGPDEMIVSASDLSALIAQLEAAQKEIHDLKMKLSDAGCLLVEWKHRVEQSEYTANKAEAALSAAQLDATRWRALLSSPAIRILGHAGLQDDKPIDGHYCHFGMEVWSHYEPYYDNKKAGELITRYADNMIAASLVEGEPAPVKYIVILQRA